MTYPIIAEAGAEHSQAMNSSPGYTETPCPQEKYQKTKNPTMTQTTHGGKGFYLLMYPYHSLL